MVRFLFVEPREVGIRSAAIGLLPHDVMIDATSTGPSKEEIPSNIAIEDTVSMRQTE